MKYKVDLSFIFKNKFLLNPFLLFKKAKYKPSELLCSETFQYFPLSSSTKKLEEKGLRYCRFNDDPLCKNDFEKLSENELNTLISRIPIKLRNEVAFIDQLNQKGKSIVQPILKEFVSRIGTELCTQFLIEM